MIPDLAEILPFAQGWLATALAVFLRLGAAFLVLPAIGERFVPVRVRLGAAAAMTVLLVPSLRSLPWPSLPSGAPDLDNLLISEPLAGLILGIGLRLTVHALQVAGAIAAQSTSLSQIMGAPVADPQPAIGTLLFLAGLTLAVMADLHVRLAGAMIDSYALLPAGALPFSGDLGAWGVGRVAQVFALAFSLAAPFLLASLLYNLALGVINKAMPQLMVAFVGAPAITLGGLVLLLLSLPILLPVWMAAFDAALAHPLGPLP